MSTNYEELLHRQVVGGLKSAIDAHPDFTPRQLIASQAKRIVHDVVSEHGVITRVRQEYQSQMGWISFWGGVALGSTFVGMIALMIIRLTAR